jgi:hypothetical protein
VPVELHLLRDQPHNYARRRKGDARVQLFCVRWPKKEGVIVVTKRAAAMGLALSMPARKDDAASGAFPRSSSWCR